MGKNASDPEYLMRHAEYHGIWKLEESFERMAVPRLRAEEGEGRGAACLVVFSQQVNAAVTDAISFVSLPSPTAMAA